MSRRHAAPERSPRWSRFPLLVLVLALMLGVPIAVALAGSGMLGIYLITGDFAQGDGHRQPGAVQHGRRLRADHDPDVHPDGVLLGVERAGARPLHRRRATGCSHIRGGLAIATVFACGIFGAMSGASTAAASVMSKIAMPEMRRHGYSDELARGRNRHRRDARHSDPAEHRHGDLRHRHPDLDRQAPDRRRRAGAHRRHPARRHDLSLGRSSARSTRPPPIACRAAERWASLARIWPSLLLIFARAGAALYRHRDADRGGRARRAARRPSSAPCSAASPSPMRSTR